MGMASASAGSGQDASQHHFTGKERDTESGLDNFGARYYGSTMGRFMSPMSLVRTSRRPADSQQVRLRGEQSTLAH